jgi:hypothetical protein
MTVLALLLLAAGPNPYLAQAKVLHQGLEFEKCLKRLEQASRWESTRAELAEIELYSGLCQFGLGKEREAAEHFEMGLKLEPKLALPPLVGPKVTAQFQKAQAKIVHAAQDAPVTPEPVKEPVKEPPKTVAVEPAPPPVAPPAPAAAVSVEPPPAAKPRSLAAPIALAVVSAASAITAGVLGFQANSLQTQANGATFESDAVMFGSQAKTFALVTNVLWGVAGAALIAAVITFFAL